MRLMFTAQLGLASLVVWHKSHRQVTLPADRPRAEYDNICASDMLIYCLTWCCSTWMRVGLPVIGWENLIYHPSTDRPVPCSSMHDPSSSTPGDDPSSSTLDAMPQDCNKPGAAAESESNAWVCIPACTKPCTCFWFGSRPWLVTVLWHSIQK